MTSSLCDQNVHLQVTKGSLAGNKIPKLYTDDVNIGQQVMSTGITNQFDWIHVRYFFGFLSFSCR